jgi:ribosomal protein L40E
MPEILTESFCERCGTRYTFEAQVPKKSSLGKLRTLSKGFKNYVLSDETTLEEAFADARHDEDREITSHQLDAFHKTFNFCMSCRQYTCGNCWNDAENRCLSCAPHVGQEVLPATFPHLQSALGISTTADAIGNGHAAAPPSDISAWPTADLQPSSQAPAVEADVDVETAARLATLFGSPAPVAEADTEVVVEPEAFAEPEVVPEAGAFAEAEAFAQPEAVAEPWAAPEAEPFAEVEAFAEAEAFAEPEAVLEPETLPEPEVFAEPRAEVLAEPEAVAEAETDITDVERAVEEAHRIAAERAAAAAEQTRAIFGILPEGAAEDEIEPLVAAEAEPEVEAEIEPLVAAEAEPEVEPEIEPLVAAEAEPEVEPLVAAEAEPEPVAASAPEPPPAPTAPRITTDRVEMPTWQVVAPETTPAPPNGAPLAQPALPAAATADGLPRPGEARPTEATQWPSEPEWPTQPAWPSHLPSYEPVRPPTSEASSAIQSAWPAIDARTATAHRGDAMWAASSRDVLVNRPEAGVQACVSCGLPLSATARFCRRCGTQQG